MGIPGIIVLAADCGRKSAAIPVKLSGMLKLRKKTAPKYKTIRNSLSAAVHEKDVPYVVNLSKSDRQVYHLTGIWISILFGKTIREMDQGEGRSRTGAVKKDLFPNRLAGFFRRYIGCMWFTDTAPFEKGE